MSSPLGSHFYHVFTKKSTDHVIELNIPRGYKVLSGGIRAYGATGILSSFYDAERGRWFLQHDPIDDGASVLLQVVTLVDPEDRYDVAVSVASLRDVIGPEEREKLMQLDECQYPAHLLESKDEARSAQAVIEKQRQRCRCRMSGRDTVTLHCPVVDGYTLTGGGFISGYPVLASSADTCEEWDQRELLTRSGESSSVNSNGVPTKMTACATASTRSGVLCDSFPDPSHCSVSSNSLKNTRRNKSPTAWFVMAAENLLLSCYAIGIRLRTVPQEEILRGMKSTTLLNQSKCDASSETTVAVKVHHQSRGKWAIELPPPHGIFIFRFGASRTPNPIVLSSFYR
ncbi:hypothetical protein MOQ_002864 [Trypanosoma cruzi marinkellei]|uniref:Uncharacterized protein n=1 Tax=Trypanosoma cruzi marinkellei TaxID=85056 RepID=K2NWI2_TRYCR|nr:hypothetical protein MOQ_002864 [Trypanosoma cruzi marinkellei]